MRTNEVYLLLFDLLLLAICFDSLVSRSEDVGFKKLINKENTQTKYYHGKISMFFLAVFFLHSPTEREGCFASLLLSLFSMFAKGPSVIASPFFFNDFYHRIPLMFSHVGFHPFSKKIALLCYLVLSHKTR